MRKTIISVLYSKVICYKNSTPSSCTRFPNCISVNNNFIRKYTTAEESLVDEDERKKFDKVDFDWWDAKGPMKALHTMNAVRVPFIRDCLLYKGVGGQPFSTLPLSGVDILEVGCGAGILSEPLCRLGATVTAIDTAENAITAAIKHRSDNLELQNLQYINAHLEDIVTVGSLRFDAVIASEVIEHVSDPDKFITCCSSVLKEDGSLFISTINRTTISNILAVVAAENIFCVVDRGTHDWNKFVTVPEITTYLQNANCGIKKIHGLFYNPVCNNWTFMDNQDMNYILHATKHSKNYEETDTSEATEET